MRTSVGVNPFVLRQTATSRFSFFAGSHETVANLVELSLRQGNFRKAPWQKTDDILYVTVPPAGFYSGVVKIEEGDLLRSRFAARQDGEDPCIGTVILPNEDGTFDASKKVAAQYCEVLIYSRRALIDDYEREKKRSEEAGDTPKPLGKFVGSSCDYEVVSENASANKDATPADPVSIARNVFADDLNGGTKIDIQGMAERELRSLVLELCNGAIFWSQHAMCAED